MHTSSFQYTSPDDSLYGWWDYGIDKLTANDIEDNPYIQNLLQTASFLKIDEDDILLLLNYGFEESEIESLMYDPTMFKSFVADIKMDLHDCYYDEDEFTLF